MVRMLHPDNWISVEVARGHLLHRQAWSICEVLVSSPSLLSVVVQKKRSAVLLLYDDDHLVDPVFQCVMYPV